jgi:hypothetical protein
MSFYYGELTMISGKEKKRKKNLLATHATSTLVLLSK